MRTKNPGEFLIFNENSPIDENEPYTFNLHESYEGSLCQHNHEPTICRCHLPLYHIGQDESVYHSHSVQSEAWCVDSVQPLRKKNEGKGEMVSAFVDATRGFGFPLSPLELVGVNLYRAERGRPPLSSSPGKAWLC